VAKKLDETMVAAEASDWVGQAKQLRQRLDHLWAGIKVLTALSLGIRLGPLQGQCVLSKLSASA